MVRAGLSGGTGEHCHGHLSRIGKHIDLREPTVGVAYAQGLQCCKQLSAGDSLPAMHKSHLQDAEGRPIDKGSRKWPKAQRLECARDLTEPLGH